MKLIKEIFWDIKPAELTQRKWTYRRAVRALVKDGDKIAVLKSTKYDFYKCLPGGGVENDEDLTTALRREIREEVGCEIEITDEIGLCLEYIGDFSCISASFVFVANKVAAGKQQLTAAEMDAGFVLEWHTPQEVFALIAKTQPTNKRGDQQMQREKFILEHYLSKIPPTPNI